MLLEVLTGLYLTRDQVSWSKAGGGGVQQDLNNKYLQPVRPS